MEIEDGGMAEEAADWFSRSFQLQIFGKKIDAAAAKPLAAADPPPPLTAASSLLRHARIPRSRADQTHTF